MESAQETTVHLEAAEKLKDMLKIFYIKKPKVTVKSGLTGFSQNADTLSPERMTEAEFQPLGYVDGNAVIVYRTHDGKEVGYGIYDETAYTILTMDLLDLIGQLVPGEEATTDQIRSLNLLVDSMEKLVGIQYT